MTGKQDEQRLSKKRGDFAKFHSQLLARKNWWTGRVIIPYSLAYGDAYAAYRDTLKKADQDQAARVDMYLAVALLFAGPIVRLAPIAAVIKGGKVASRKGIKQLAILLSKLKIENKVAAYKMLKNFAFGGIPTFSKTIWTVQGKKIVKGHFTKFQKGALPQSGNKPGGFSTSTLRGTPRNKLPLEYYLGLQGVLLKSINAITTCAIELINNPDVSPENLKEFLDDIEKNSLLFKNAPKKPFEKGFIKGLANEMELAMWAFSAVSWRWTQTTTRDSMHGTGSTTSTSTVYSKYIAEDRVLERIDKVAKNLKMTQYVTKRTSSGSPAKKGTVKGANWINFAGWVMTASEKDTLIQWANTYLNHKASKVVMPVNIK